MVTEDTFKITGEFCAKTNPLFSYSSKILRDWITSIYCKVCPNVLWFFLPFPLYKKILINKPGSQFSTINKFYVQATVAFMSVRCKSKFTSYVKHYTRREKQGRFLVLKDICVSIKSASCVLNTAGWSYSDQMAFCLSLEICQAQLFSRAASVSGSSGETQDKPLLYYQSCGNSDFPAAGAVEQPGSCQVPRGSGMARIEPKLELCFHSREPGSLVELGHQKETKKAGKDPAVLINHRVTPEHQLFLGRADLILGRGTE